MILCCRIRASGDAKTKRFALQKLTREFRLDWSETYKRYQGDILLKQGIYDYQYVVARPGERPDPTPLEGLRRLTENFYSILVYYRKPGDRAARIVGFQAVNYRD